MQIVSKSNFIERIIVSPDGAKYSVLFYVYVEAGKIKAKAISAKLISGPKACRAQTQCLPCKAGKSLFQEAAPIFFEKTIPSPYSSILRFNCTIPRAPSFARERN